MFDDCARRDRAPASLVCIRPEGLVGSPAGCAFSEFGAWGKVGSVTNCAKGEGMSVRRGEQRFEPDEGSARASRQYLRAELTAQDVGDPPLENAILLVSELVTNAVVHARTDITVRYLVEPAVVRIEVEDHNSRTPVAAAAPIDATSGRGLLLLQELSDRWGVVGERDGKCIWFEVPLPS